MDKYFYHDFAHIFSFSDWVFLNPKKAFYSKHSSGRQKPKRGRGSNIRRCKPNKAQGGSMKDLGLVALGVFLCLMFFVEVISKQKAEKQYCDGNNSIYAYAGRSYSCPNYKGGE